MILWAGNTVVILTGGQKCAMTAGDQSRLEVLKGFTHIWCLSVPHMASLS